MSAQLFLYVYGSVHQCAYGCGYVHDMDMSDRYGWFAWRLVSISVCILICALYIHVYEYMCLYECGHKHGYINMNIMFVYIYECTYERVLWIGIQTFICIWWMYMFICMYVYVYECLCEYMFMFICKHDKFSPQLPPT